MFFLPPLGLWPRLQFWPQLWIFSLLHLAKIFTGTLQANKLVVQAKMMVSYVVFALTMQCHALFFHVLTVQFCRLHRSHFGNISQLTGSSISSWVKFPILNTACIFLNLLWQSFQADIQFGVLVKIQIVSTVGALGQASSPRHFLQMYLPEFGLESENCICMTSTAEDQQTEQIPYFIACSFSVRIQDSKISQFSDQSNNTRRSCSNRRS